MFTKTSAPSGSQPLPTWQDLAHQHMKLLNEHLSLWTLVQNQHTSHPQVLLVTEQCISHTQTMIKNLETLSATINSPGQAAPSNTGSQISKGQGGQDSAASQKSTHGQNETLTLRPSKRKRTEHTAGATTVPGHGQPILDRSGLFSIDSNPTPVDQLLARTSEDGDAIRQPKRTKRSKAWSNQAQPTKSSASNEQGSIPAANQNDTNNIHHTNNTVTEAADSPQPDADKEADAFLAKVAKRHQEKEAKRKKKSDKKRKRGSGTSIESLDVQEPGRGDNRRKKKLRQEDRIEG